MPVFALLCVIVVLVGASGCTPGANEDLKRVVDAAFLPEMESSSGNCEWGFSTVEHEPKSWFGCWGYVSGDYIRIGARIAAQLSEADFKVSAARDGLTIEVTAVRGSETVCVDVLAPGFKHGRNTSPAEINPDSGEVFVDVWSAELRERGGSACAELPAWQQ